MAYRKRYRKRRTYKKKAKGASNKQVTVWSDHSVLEKANRALALVNNVRRFINTEIKHKDVTSSATYSYNGTLRDLSAITVGDTEQQRDGQSVKPLNLTVRGLLTGDSSGANCQIRVIIFRMKQENGVTPTAADILENTGSANVIFSPKNYTDRFRSNILHDQVYCINQQLSTIASTKYFEKVIKMNGHISFDGTGTTRENGGIYMFIFSNRAPASAEPTVSFTSRLTFTDN